MARPWRPSDSDLPVILTRASIASERGAILYTRLESCRRRGINQRKYLLDELTRLPAMKTNEVAELTPAR